eukprot:876483-Pleurochrysis_carterae.AAC.2
MHGPWRGGRAAPIVRSSGCRPLSVAPRGARRIAELRRRENAAATTKRAKAGATEPQSALPHRSQRQRTWSRAHKATVAWDSSAPEYSSVPLSASVACH